MPNVEKILAERVEFQVESIDRMYLNLYVPRIQHANGVLQFLRGHRKQQIASPALLGQMTRAFVADIDAFAEEQAIPVLYFKKGERKEDVAKREFARFTDDEGVVFIGVAQERASAFRSSKEKRDDGLVRFHFYRGSVYVNHYYFYILDRDFGPTFIKLCSYVPFTGRVWLNGHEWAKRQLDRAGIDVVASCAGAIRTPGYARTAAREAPGTLDAMQVAEETLDALGRGPRVVPGRVNRLASTLMTRLLPRRTAVAVMAASTRDLS